MCSSYTLMYSSSKVTHILINVYRGIPFFPHNYALIAYRGMHYAEPAGSTAYTFPQTLRNRPRADAQVCDARPA